MSMRVATFASTGRMLDASMRVQARMTEMQLQEATGVKSTSYGDLGAESRRLIDLKTASARSSSYASAASEASSRIDAMYSALGQVTDLLTDFRSQISSSLSTDSDETSSYALVSAAETYLGELTSILNTSFEGRYLFSGSLTGTAPVDLSDYTANSSTASTDYYAGNDQIASVRASSELTISYGVTADNSAFEQAIRALSTIASATATLDSDTLEAAYTLLGTGLNETVALQSGLSTKSSTLARVSTWHADYQDVLSASISEVRDVDVAELTVMLTTYQTQLEASYAALGKVMSLSLQDYL